MDIFLQVVLGTVMLSSLVDNEGYYYKCFSSWISRNKHRWGLLTTREYHNQVEKSGEYLLTTPDHAKKRLFLNVSETSLPWLVLTCHVLLGFTTDPKPIAKLLTCCGFVKVDDAIIKSIVEWSTYPPRLKEVEQESPIKAFESLQEAVARGDHLGMGPLQLRTRYWKMLYKHHSSTPGLNPMHNTAGVVFYALVSLYEGAYSIIFVDQVTDAFYFPPQVIRADSTDAISKPIAQALSTFMVEFGHPEYFVLVNPLRDWIHSAMVEALGMLTEPSTSQFIAPRQLSTNLNCAPNKVENLLASIEKSLKDETFLKALPPFSLIRLKGSWPEMFMQNKYWIHPRQCCSHPRGGALDSRLMFDKELKVVDLPSLKTVEISEGTYDLLKCQRPGGKGVESVVQFPEMLDEALDAKFASLVDLSDGFSLASREPAAATVDHVSRKTILHVWQCFKHGQGRNIPDDELKHLLSRGHDVFKAINTEENKWLFKGTELARGKLTESDDDTELTGNFVYDTKLTGSDDDTISISIVTGEGSTDRVTWWKDGMIGSEVFAREPLLDFLPKTVEQAVEDDDHMDETEDGGGKLQSAENPSWAEGEYRFGDPDKDINSVYREHLNKSHPVVQTVMKVQQKSRRGRGN